MPDEGDLGLTPPLTIRRLAESYIIRAAAERSVASVCGRASGQVSREYLRRQSDLET